MEGVYSHFQQYVQTGGITMYPLILCCFWMWLLIIFNVPLWRLSVNHQCEQLKEQYCLLQRENLRHNRQLYNLLLKKNYEQSIKGISTIKVLAAVAPFLGLFGTVTGMINTFESVATFGLGNPKALAAGISEAMITTQFGLLIAVPGILAVFFLQRRAHRDQRKVRQITGELVRNRR